MARSPTTPVRWFDLVPSGAPSPGGWPAAGNGSATALVHAGNRFVAAYSRSQSGWGANLDTTYKAQNPGDTKSPVAITYQLGCP